MATYQFYQMKTKSGNEKIVCASHFAGETVRGVAICSSNDTFDPEVGRELARLRCDQKIAEKRHWRAIDKLRAAIDTHDSAARREEDMRQYLNDSIIKRDRITKKLSELEHKLDIVG